jgi:hypothetical protein
MQPSEEMLPFFANTQLKEHDSDYLIIKIEKKFEEEITKLFSDFTFFKSYTVDHDEISLIVKKKEWEQCIYRLTDYIQEGPYRLITFDIVLDLSLIGYLSVVSSVLADEGISIFAVSTYLRDHILIKKQDSVRALETLNTLIVESKMKMGA